VIVSICTCIRISVCTLIIGPETRKRVAYRYRPGRAIDIDIVPKGAGAL
jgi:hypothetical protein